MKSSRPEPVQATRGKPTSRPGTRAAGSERNPYISLLRLQQSAGNAAASRAIAGRIQRKLLSVDQTQQAGEKSLRAWLSPELSNFTKKQGLPNAVRGVLKGFVEQGNFDEEDVANVSKLVEDYQGTVAVASPPAFDAFVEKLGADGGKEEYVQFLKAMDFGKAKPAIVFGHAVTTAFYDATKHVVVLDPWKLETATAMLDSLTFECQNALQRVELKAGLKDTTGAKTAAVEYESDKKYVEALKSIHKASSLDDLATAVGIPTNLLTPADFSACVAAKTVALPARSEMPEQDKRQTLWWWKTQSWSDEERKQVWVIENHGEGVASSVELYSH